MVAIARRPASTAISMAMFLLEPSRRPWPPDMQILPVLLIWIVSSGVLRLRSLQGKAAPPIRSCADGI
jgi:hypothetical protein